MDNNTPIGQTPVETQGKVEVAPQQAPVAPQDTGTAELQAQLEQAQRERDEARANELKANRALEAGRKFERFEDFQKDVYEKLNGLEKTSAEKDAAHLKEINDLKAIITNKQAIEPSFSSAPTTPPVQVEKSQEVERLNHIFGSKLKV